MLWQSVPFRIIILENSDDSEEVIEIISSTQNDDLLQDSVLGNLERYEITEEQGQTIINNT